MVHGGIWATRSCDFLNRRRFGECNRPCSACRLDLAWPRRRPMNVFMDSQAISLLGGSYLIKVALV